MKYLTKEWIDVPKHIAKHHPRMEDKAAIEIRPLRASEFSQAISSFNDDQSKGILLALEAVLAWKGINDESGNPAALTVEYIDELGADLCDWLVQSIFEKSRLPKAAEKN